MSSDKSERPAILGGQPIRTAGPPEWPYAIEPVQQVLRKMLGSGDWGRYHGPHIPELCRSLSRYFGVDHVLVCSSGTAAVELALRGVGVHAADEVIMAAYDFKANFQNIIQLQAIPVLVDVDPETRQLDPSKIEAAITPKTRCIIMSHLHGGVVMAPRVREIADQHCLALIEDACQNPGAKIFGRNAGTWGNVGVLSFGGSKLLTAGRGGAIMSSNPEIIERIKRYTLRGNDAYPLSEIQAAILKPQLDQLDLQNERRRGMIDRLFQLLTDFPGLIPLQQPTSDISPAYYKVGFRYLPEDFDGLRRDVFVEAIKSEGIALDAGFRSNHLIHGSRRFRASDDLKEATQADSGIVTLHHPVLLEGATAMDEIVVAIRKIRDFAAEISQVI